LKHRHFMKFLLHILELVSSIVPICFLLIWIYVIGIEKPDVDLVSAVIIMLFFIAISFIPYYIVAFFLRRLYAKESESATQIKGARLSHVLRVIVKFFIPLSAFAVFFVFYYSPDNSFKGGFFKATNTVTEGREIVTYEYPSSRLKLAISSEWEQISVEELTMPTFIPKAEFALRKRDTSCVLAFVNAHAEAFQKYDDVTDRISVDDKSRLEKIANENLPGPISIQAYGEKQSVYYTLSSYESETSGDKDSSPQFETAVFFCFIAFV